MKTVRVAAAVIRQGDKIFAAARGYGEFKGRWEFPGGKIEEGETSQQALIREIKEELGADIEVGEIIDTIEYDYPSFHLSMDCFWAKAVSGDFVLKEASDAKWLTREELDKPNWLPADLALIDKIKRELLNDECVRYTEQELLQMPGVDTVLKINKSDIKEINKKSLKKKIAMSCSGKNLWAMFGYVDDKNMVCLQVASSGNIAAEIVADLCCMQPVCDNDTRFWRSRFHKKIFPVTYGLDSKCQKYRDMYDHYESFYVVSVDHELFLKKMSEKMYSSIRLSVDHELFMEKMRLLGQYDTPKQAEVLFAYKMQALYWVPFGEENKILNKIEEIEEELKRTR